MPKIPRDINGFEFASFLDIYGYVITRQTGSHIRLTSYKMGYEHHVTIPNHKPLKIGTLHSILNEISAYLSISKQEIINSFSK
jgi:predicted RNA binding protein YcfA (HicA-like mRNA interferase family)